MSAWHPQSVPAYTGPSPFPVCPAFSAQRRMLYFPAVLVAARKTERVCELPWLLTLPQPTEKAGSLLVPKGNIPSRKRMEGSKNLLKCHRYHNRSMPWPYPLTQALL